MPLFHSMVGMSERTVDNEKTDDFNKLFFPVIAILLGLLLDVLKKRIELKVPDSVLLFLVTFAIGIIGNFCTPKKTLLQFEKLYLWTSLDPNTILTVRNSSCERGKKEMVVIELLLPALLFESSFKMNAPLLMFRLRTVIALTLFVYSSAALLTSTLYLAVIHVVDDWNPHIVVLFACVLSATDPVAVVAVLESMGAPHRLRILVEGESLLNDGLAIFAFHNLLRLYKRQNKARLVTLKIESAMDVDVSESLLWQITRSLLGCLVASPLLGIAAGFFTVWACCRVHEEKRKQTLIGLSVYASYLACDAAGSGALGVVCFGLTMSYMREHLLSETCFLAEQLWTILAYFFNNVIFCFAGAMVAFEIFKTSPMNEDKDIPIALYMMPTISNLLSCLAGFFLAPWALFSRVLSIFIFYQILSRVHHGHRQPAETDYALLAFGGVRGALGLILALELRLHVEKSVARSVLIMTCFSTFFSLVVQGLLFGPFAAREGRTRRSLYIEESRSRLYQFVCRRRYLIIKRLQSQDRYLVGAKWEVVNKHVDDFIASLKPEHFKSSVTASNPAKANEENSEYKEEDELDVKGSFFSCLLARVHLAWEHGAISAKTAHVIIGLLEQAIDEGGLSVEDCLEHLSFLHPPECTKKVLYYMRSLVSRAISTSLISALSLTNADTLFTPLNPLQTLSINRSIEKWYLFSAFLSVAHFVYALYTWHAKFNFDQRLIFLLGSLFYCLFCIGEECILFRNIFSLQKRMREAGRWLKFWGELLACFFSGLRALSLVAILFYLVFNGRCLLPPHPADCQLLLLLVVTLCGIHLFQRLLRVFPTLLILFDEYFESYAEKDERVRLSVLFYLYHMGAAARIPRDMFSAHAYLVVRHEQSHFDKIVDALFRYELKRQASFEQMMPMIKTRQAIRIVSTHLTTLLSNLKSEGFREDEGWHERIQMLRDATEMITTTPPLNTNDWLCSLSWLAELPPKQRSEVSECLKKAFDDQSKQFVFSVGERIFTRGARLFFITQGICRQTEWLSFGGVSTPRHHSYIRAGHFIGFRNFLLIGRGRSVKKLPLHWPRHEYEARTEVRGVWLEEEVVLSILEKAKELVGVFSRSLQIDQLRKELRHFDHGCDIVDHEGMELHFKSKGKVVKTAETINISRGKTAILGCWIELLAVSRSSALQIPEGYIVGPAKIRAKPAIGKHSVGLLLLHDTGILKKTSKEGTTASVISLKEKAERETEQGRKENLFFLIDYSFPAFKKKQLVTYSVVTWMRMDMESCASCFKD